MHKYQTHITAYRQLQLNWDQKLAFQHQIHPILLVQQHLMDYVLIQLQYHHPLTLDIHIPGRLNHLLRILQREKDDCSFC